MSWSWNQTVADEVLRLVNDRRAPDFCLDDLYARQAAFESRFPNNGHVREKVRQTLQRLRDEGFITFQGKGEYRLNLEFEDLDIVPATDNEVGLPVPKRRLVARNVILRDTLLATSVKRRYEFTCQVCHTALEMTVGRYAEGHHLKPLGAPHNGPDVESNILVLCPNHHAMFDRGALFIEPDSFLVHHARRAMETRALFIHDWHKLNPAYINYHREKVYCPA